MKYTYRVRHSEECKSKVDTFFYPFSQEKQLREYSSFPQALHQHFIGTSIEVSCESPTMDGMLVTLVTDKPAHEADSALAEFVVKQNYASRGLCLVIDTLKD